MAAKPEPALSRSEAKRYDTLDDLAKDFRPGVRFRYHPQYHLNPKFTEIATVVGYVYSLPLEAGGRDEPALVVETQYGTIGNVYPFEVVTRGR